MPTPTPGGTGTAKSRRRPEWTTVVGGIAALALVLALAITQLQSHGKGVRTPAADASNGNGIVLPNGNTLYGSEAKAYCENFAVDTTDMKTIRACVAVGADVTSDKADAQAAEDEKQKQAEEDYKTQSAAASTFRPAVKQAVGKNKYGNSDLLALTEPSDGQLLVETFWVTRATHNDPVSDTDGDATIATTAKYERVCDAIQKSDPTIAASIKTDDNEVHSC